MRVLQIGMTANHGGIETFVLNYAKVLKKYGIHFDYVDLYGKGLAESEWIYSEGSQVYTLQDYRKHPLAAVKQIKEIVRSKKYTCVHINMLSAASLVTVIGSLWGGANVLVHSHNTQALGLHRRVLHGMNAIILRCLPVKRLACGNMAGVWMFGKKNFEVIPNALDTKQYRFCLENRNALRKKLDVEEDTVVLGFVGRLSAQKNPEYLAKILDAVKKRGFENVKLLVVGDGELREQFLKAAMDFGVAADVVCVGSQSNVNQWYSAMDALLLPSLWEGLPLVGVEAQTAGLPCFFSDLITEELAMTELAHFCKLTGTADNWAEAILKYMNTTLPRYDYADCIAKTSYSIDQSAERLQKIYCSVADTKEVSKK